MAQRDLLVDVEVHKPQHSRARPPERLVEACVRPAMPAPFPTSLSHLPSTIPPRSSRSQASRDRRSWTPEILDTPDMPPAIPLEASSPAPAPSLPASPDTLACDSGYESNSPRPAPRTTTRGKLADKRATRRHAPYPRSPSLASSPGGSPSSISSLPSPGSGTPELKVSRRRNIQLPALPSSPSSPSASGPDSSSIAGRWCQGCEKTFPRMNKAEFNRHVKSHTGEANKCDWVCTGVPIELACEVYKLSVDRIQQLEAEGRAMWWNGRYMVGGCRTSVSRRDALKRHLRLSQGNCVGDQNGDWQIGNAKK